MLPFKNDSIKFSKGNKSNEQNVKSSAAHQQALKRTSLMSIATKHTDEQLMEQVSQENLSVLSVLFDRYQVPLYNFFYRQNYDAALSEDLVQTVFERILKYRQSYVPSMSFRSWIYQIARNAKTDHYKSQQRISDFVQPSDLEITTASIENSMVEKEDLQQLERAMKELPDQQREILVMTRFQKMRYRDVADILQCSEGAVKVKAHRALKQLRHIFFKMER